MVARAGLPGDGGVVSGRRRGQQLEGRRRSTSSCGPTSWLVDNYCGVCLRNYAIAATRACFEVTRYSPPPSGSVAASGSAAGSAASAASPAGFAGECTPISAPLCAAMDPVWERRRRDTTATLSRGEWALRRPRRRRRGDMPSHRRHRRDPSKFKVNEDAESLAVVQQPVRKLRKRDSPVAIHVQRVHEPVDVRHLEQLLAVVRQRIDHLAALGELGSI